ncbi:MAG: YjfB family protein [Lachnospiraceae bacterium]|nr:YjfB family protein [Lachnospiraceae bacterium]
MDVMSIANMSVSMSQSKVMQDINFALVDNAIEQLEDNGAALTKMMEASVTPNLGQNIDISI